MDISEWGRVLNQTERHVVDHYPEGLKLIPSLDESHFRNNDKHAESVKKMVRETLVVFRNACLDGRDGPRPPNLLIKGELEISVPPTPWRLLDFMWSKKRADVIDVESQVWHLSNVADQGIPQAIHKANEALRKCGFSKTLHRSGDFITW